MSSRTFRSLAFLLAAATLARGGLPADDWSRAEPGRSLVYPRDHGSHPDQRTEWWYITGQLADGEGALFGFQFTIFRRGIDPRAAGEGESALRAHQVYAGHLAIADPARASLLVAERIRRECPLASASTTDLELHLEDWSLVRSEGDRLALAAGDAAAGASLELELRPEKPLVLHGDRGYSQKGPEPGNASMYASWTRLAVHGRLELGDRTLDVHGMAWFDHEFGTSQLPQGVAGWDWFSLQLDDGRELMLYRLRDERGESAAHSSGTLVEADGRAIPLSREEFAIDSFSTWTSARTGARYPASWRVRVLAQGIDVRVTPLLADCELDTTHSTGVVYWEGPTVLEGTSSGRGYAELTGYAGSLAGRF
jgi:predicted secreted hydrolase